MDRREFLKNMGLVAAAGIIPPELLQDDQMKEEVKYEFPSRNQGMTLSSDEAFSFDWQPYGGFYVK